MMIQPVGVLQSYAVQANSQAKTGRDSGGVTSLSGGPTSQPLSLPLEVGSSKSDSLNLSVEGMAAYAYQTLREKAVSEINRLLQEADGSSQPLEDLDPASHTPEKTADFIVSRTTGFFENYAAGHPELKEQGLLDGFMEVISGGLKRGLEEARDILEGLDVLNGLVAEGIEETDSLIWEKLQVFYDSKLTTLSDLGEQTLADAA
jgi:hypothetical protein